MGDKHLNYIFAEALSQMWLKGFLFTQCDHDANYDGKRVQHKLLISLCCHLAVSFLHAVN